MPSNAHIGFIDNMKDVVMLYHIQAGLTGSKKGIKLRRDIINRTSIVFISACWESYIEDIASESFNYLLDNANDPSVFPSKVQTLASQTLLESNDRRRVWELAADGWKDVLVKHKNEIFTRWLGYFHTPKANKIRDLFANLIGLTDLCSHWCWEDTAADQACCKLDYYISVRGNIAHRTKHYESINKSDSKDFRRHVTRLVKITDECLREFLTERTGTSPW